MPKVAIIIGSKNDYDIVKEALATLEKFSVDYEIKVMSAHRTPELAAEFASNADKNGIEVIIAGAGKAAHLAGVIAGHSVLPVIGLPILSSTMDGLDSLLSTVQMPKGVPVATVAINGAVNAALLAVQILSLKYDNLKTDLYAYKKTMAEDVVKDNQALNNMLKMPKKIDIKL